MAAWWREVGEDDLWLSSLVLGEIRRSVELVGRNNEQRAWELERWLVDVISGFGDRILPVDTAVAEEWGRMNTVRRVPVVDALLAATAKVKAWSL